MNCPHCHQPLSEAEIRTLASRLNLSKRKRAGRLPSCECGTCRKCKQRAYKRKAREAK